MYKKALAFGMAFILSFGLAASSSIKCNTVFAKDEVKEVESEDKTDDEVVSIDDSKDKEKDKEKDNKKQGYKNKKDAKNDVSSDGTDVYYEKKNTNQNNTVTITIPTKQGIEVNNKEGVEFAIKENVELDKKKNVEIGLGSKNGDFNLVLENNPEYKFKYNVEFLNDKKQVLSSKEMKEHVVLPDFDTNKKNIFNEFLKLDDLIKLNKNKKKEEIQVNKKYLYKVSAKELNNAKDGVKIRYRTVTNVDLTSPELEEGKYTDTITYSIAIK